MGVAKSILDEPNRQKLDSIVQKMIDNGEPEDNIRFVVDDFKSKYGKKKASLGEVGASFQGGGTGGSSAGPSKRKTPDENIKEIGLDFSVEPKQYLAPTEQFGELPTPYKQTKHIDLSKGDDVAFLSETIHEKINSKFKGANITDLADRYGKLNPSFLNKYPETATALKAREELMPVIGQAAQQNAYRDAIGDKNGSEITREDAKNVAIDFIRQTSPSNYKRQKTIIDAGKDLGDENKYNLEKLGLKIIENNTNPNDELSQVNLNTLNQETDKAHPEYSLSKGMDILGAYNHQKDNKASNGFWRTRPTVGEAKRWLNEPEFQGMFKGNEFAYKILKEKLSQFPEEYNFLKIDNVPISGFLNRASQAVAGGFENIGNIFRSDASRQQSNLNPSLGTGTFTGNYRLPGQNNEFESRLNQLQDKDKNEQLTPEEQQEYNSLKRITGVRSGWDKFMDASGDITGQVVLQALGTKGIGAVSKLPTSISAGLTTALNSYDPVRQQAVYLFPDDKTKQNIYTGGMVAANALSERIFKDEKVIDGFLKGVKSDITQTVKNLSAKEISRQEVKNIIGKNLLKFGGETIKTANQEALEEGITQVVDETLQGSLGAEDYDKTKAIKRIGETYLTTLLNGSVIASISASPKLRNNEFNGVGLYRMAMNPEVSWNELNKLHEEGEITEDQLKEKRDILYKAFEIAHNEPENVSVLQTKKRAEYLSQTLNAQLKQEQAEKTKDKNKAAEIQNESIKSEQKAAEIYKEGTKDVELLKSITDRDEVGEAEKGADLQYFIDKAGESPLEAERRFGKEATEELLKRVPTEKLQENYDFLAKMSAENPEVDAIAKELDRREAPTAEETFPEGNQVPIETVTDETATKSDDFSKLSDADIERKMMGIEDNKGDMSEFNRLEKEMEKRERDTVFSVPLDKVSEAIDGLMVKEKEQPNGYGAFIEKRDARETKEVAEKYLQPERITDKELRTDFKDAILGNPDTWYADGLKLRESMKEASNRGIDIKDMVSEVESEFVKDGFTPEDAKATIARKLAPIFKGSQKVETNESKLISNEGTKSEPNKEKVYYHGTPSKDFKGDFDEKRIGERDSGFLGTGFYFTEDKTIADPYSYKNGKKGKVLERNLSIKNPLILDKEYVNPRELAEDVFKYIDEERAKKGKEPYRQDKREEDILELTKGIEDAKYGVVVGRELKNWINPSDYAKSRGYDAIIGSKEILVFDKSQIKEIKNDKANIQQSNKENQQSNLSTEEAKPVDEVVNEGGEGSVPPAEPPPAKPEEGGRRGRLNDKGILNHLYDATNVPQEAKEGFKREGLKYTTKSQKEAEKVAKSVVELAGIDEAVSMAESQKFDGDVNSLIFAESLNRLAEQSDKETDPAKKAELDQKFAEVGIAYDNAARKGGRFNSAINYFYKKSPLGIVAMENEKRAQEFNDWSKPKDKSWREFFEELKKEPEFETILKEEVEGGMKKERAEARKARIKKVDEFFDKAKDQFKGGAAYSTIIPPKVITAALEGMKQAYHAGEKVVELVENAIEYISKQIGNDNWDKEKFRKEWNDKLKDKQTRKPLTDEEIKMKVLDKFRKKLNGLTDAEKDEVIRKAYKQLIDNGALEYEDFRKIIGEVTGRAELTPEQAERLKELVKITNSVEEAAQKARDERTPESLKKFREAEIAAGSAAKELQDMFNNKPDIVKRLTSIMQLNTLGIASLVNNPIYNIWNQATLRFPVSVVNSMIDVFGKSSEQEYNVIASQLEFWKKMGMGTGESFKQLFTGLNRMDYIQKEVQGQRIRPFQSWRDLFSKKKKLTGTQKADKILQGTVGVPAELVARMLNLGDKPQRFGAEGAQAAAFAKALGLKDMGYKLFVEFPREEAYRAYKAQGLSDAEAGKKADYVKEAIVKEGERSTFQQDNLLNDLLTRAFSVFGGKDSGTANLLKTVTVSPYIKIPSNAFWSFYNLLNPEVALLQSMVHKGRSGYYKGKGEYVKEKMQNRESRYWLAHAVVGMATRAVVMGMLGKGIITPSSDDDDSKKERDATNLYGKTGTIKVGDMDVSLRWFGQPGMLLNSMAKKYQDQTPEQKEKQDEFWRIAFGGMEVEGLKELQNGVFANASGLVNAIDGDTFSRDRYLTNLINMTTNILQPASIAQFNRAGLREVPSSRGDDLIKKIDQQFAQRSPLYRAITGSHVDDKLDIWGQPITRGGNRLSRMFGISKDPKTQFGRPIYEDFLRTGDSGFLPPSVLPNLDGTKLKEAQYRDLQNRIGTERMNIVAPYINDMSVISGYNVKYSQLSDEDKKFVLQYLYTKGRQDGIEKFYQDHPELKPKDKQKDYIKESKQEVFKILEKYKK